MVYKITITDKKTNKVTKEEFMEFTSNSACATFISEQDELGKWGKKSDHIVTFKNLDAVVFENISPRQIRLALLGMGIPESSVENTIKKLPSPQSEQAMIAWKYSTEFVRTETAISTVGQMLGLSESQLDQIWKAAILL